MLSQNTQQKVEGELKKLEKKDLDEVCDNLSGILKALGDSNINSFTKRAEALIIEGSSWEQKVAGHRSDLHAHINFLVNTCKEKLLEKLR